MPTQQQLINIYETAGWNEELIQEFINNMPKGVWNSRSDVEANAFFKAWFDNRMESLLDQMPRTAMTPLIDAIIQAKGNSLDEPFASAVIKVTKKILQRNEPYHDNDHEWFRLQDELTAKVWRRLSVIVNISKQVHK